MQRFLLSVSSIICMLSLSGGQIARLLLVLTTCGNWQAVAFSGYCDPARCYCLVCLLGAVFLSCVSLSMQYSAVSAWSFLQLCILLYSNVRVSRRSDFKLLEGLSLTRSQYSALAVVKSALCCNNTCLEEYRLQASILIFFVPYCKAKKNQTCKLLYSRSLWQHEISFQPCSLIMVFLKCIISFNRKMDCGFKGVLALLLFVTCKGAAEDIKDQGSCFWQDYYGLTFCQVQTPRKFIHFNQEKR